MHITSRTLAVPALAAFHTLVTVGCSSPAESPLPAMDAAIVDVPDDAPVTTPDALDASQPIDVGPAVEAGVACASPEGPYCGTEGCDLAPLTLPTCDDGEYAVYGEGSCGSRATLLVFVAGWCSVCQREARTVEAEVTQPYAERGLRVVNVIAQLPSGMAGTSSFCNTWRNRYGLSGAMTYDPDGRTRSHWPTGTFPVWLLVDRTGRVRYRSQYAAGGIAQLRTRIEAVLAEP